MAAAISIRVQAHDFDLAGEVATVKQANRNIGAIVTFSGVCRDDGGRLSGLELEHYPGMAEEEIRRIATETARRWPLSAITVIHRSGKIAVGENIVLVVTASEHRQAALEAAMFLMDFLKTDAPFWKKEHPTGSPEGEWVEARAEDDAKTTRWKKPVKASE